MPVVDEMLLVSQNQAITADAASTHVIDLQYSETVGTGKPVKAVAVVTETFLEELDVATITGISKANPAVVTAAAHGFSNGDEVTIVGVVGMVEVNGNTYVVAGAATNTFQLTDTNSTAFTTYVSGGSAILEERLDSIEFILEDSADDSSFAAIASVTITAPVVAGIRTPIAAGTKVEFRLPNVVRRYLRMQYKTAGDKEPVAGKVHGTIEQGSIE
jgi:hypothetical protein